jgi:hypothetical protein
MSIVVVYHKDSMDGFGAALAECFIDATFVMAKGGGTDIRATERGKGMKIMAIVDRHELPLSRREGSQRTLSFLNRVR